MLPVDRLEVFLPARTSSDLGIRKCGAPSAAKDTGHRGKGLGAEEKPRPAFTVSFSPSWSQGVSVFV